MSLFFRWLPRLFGYRRVTIRNESDARNLGNMFSEHHWDLETIIANHECSQINSRDPALSEGLSEHDAHRNIEIHGLNELPPAKEISDLFLFIKQFLNLLWVLLIVASSLSFVGWLMDRSEMDNLYSTCIMFSMIFVLCCISFIQERRARRTVKGFAKLLPQICHVIRDGQEISIPAPQITIGDIIIIRSGNRVPADCRILKCTEFKLETSSITGEAEPIEYQSGPVPQDRTVFEAHNIAFNGSLCVDGYAIGIVIRVGVDTVIGQIAVMTTGQKDQGSELEREIARFVKFLILASTSTGLICFVVGGILRKWKKPVELLANGFLVCAIGMVPCGLPASVASILTLISRRLGKNNVCLKRMDIVEAIGSVNVIASDKTGTLTKNLMTVTDLWYFDEKISGNPPQTGSVFEGLSIPVQRLLTNLCVCNAARFTATEDDIMELGDDKPLITEVLRPASGTPSEVAMIRYCDQFFDIGALRANHEMVFEIPFNSKRKWHLQIHKIGSSLGISKFRLMMKGAPEILISKCSLINSVCGPQDLDYNKLLAFQTTYNFYGVHGKRVIGCAETEFEAPEDLIFDAEKENFPTTGLTFTGMCAIMDPPREETLEAILACKEAGIKVFMVTGDHHTTAKAIAMEIGLIEEHEESCVIRGERIPHMSEEDWNTVLFNDYLVFSRTTPEQKLLIVEQCQKRGLSIVMTGDGVNDSPALKKANVGVAMGSGSEVAKQAADIVLMDDNFSSIVKAIEQGRLMFSNIKKLLGYTMPHNFPEVYPVLLYYILGMPQGITPLQILSIDLGTELLPGIAMSNEPIEDNVMKQPPREKHKKLVSNSLLAYGYGYIGQTQSLGCFLAYLYVFWSHGISPKDLLYSEDSWFEGGKPFMSGGRMYYWEEQKYILAQACAAWQIGIVFGQVFHVWCARTRKESIFVHGLFRNKVSVFGVVLEICLLLTYVYCPVVSSFLGGAAPPPLCWAIVAAVGTFVFVFNEGSQTAPAQYSKGEFVYGILPDGVLEEDLAWEFVQIARQCHPATPQLHKYQSEMRVVLEVFLIFTTSLALPPDVVESLLNGNSNGKVQGLKDPTITVFTENMKQIFGSSANMEARRVRLQRLSQKSKVNMTEADKEQIRLNLMLLEELPTKETPGIDDLNKAAGLSEYLFQGDIQLTDDQLTQLENDFTASGRKKRQASSVFRKWTGNVLYFYFDSTVPAQTKTAVNNAVQYLEANTCVRFQQSSNAANRVRVTRGDSGCNSIVGMAGGEQIMNLEDGCGYVEVTAHEFMHALGMWHIQNRPDRDGYITVNIASVDPELVSSYDKISQITNYVPYEYGSVMHYSATAFASRVGAITMVPKDSRYMNTMGSPIISFFDLKAINDHYGCSALCPSSSSAQCKNGGIPNPRQCSICICPQGYGGQLCDQRPSGCGETLTATSSWQTRTFTVSTRSSAQPEYYMCNHWITAPAGQKIQVKVTQMSNPSCDYGCHPSGIELKVNADQRITNPRLCCRSSLNQEFTSAVNPTPIFSYSRYSYSESFTIQYKAVGGPINPEPTNGCQDATISCGTWASNGFCSSSDYPLQAKKDFCPKTCNLCGESSNSCKDSSLSCATWIKNSDFCRNTDYPLAERKRYCAASCNLC